MSTNRLDAQLVVNYFDEALGEEDFAPVSATEPLPVTVVTPLSTQVRFTQVTASTTSALAIAARARRHRVILKNTDASITVYLGTGAVTSANSLPLLAGESVALETTAALNCLAASGSPVISVVEEFS